MGVACFLRMQPLKQKLVLSMLVSTHAFSLSTTQNTYSGHCNIYINKQVLLCIQVCLPADAGAAWGRLSHPLALGCCGIWLRQHANHTEQGQTRLYLMTLSLPPLYSIVPSYACMPGSGSSSVSCVPSCRSSHKKSSVLVDAHHCASRQSHEN